MDKTYCVNVSATPYTGLLAFIIFLELAAYLAAHRTPIHNRGPWVEIGPGFWTRAWRTMLRVIEEDTHAHARTNTQRITVPTSRATQHHARHTRQCLGTPPHNTQARPQERRITRMANQFGLTWDQH
ncbi:hypothetical protein C8F01DRAFT_1266128 [Mycena amicta]|nr:hypothetical protein C8F01DRAFT_1266128 [Mycena amicta]